jgi:DNA (cytosine-5)-methyltransferase 1
MRLGSLCTGIGGLDRAAEAVYGAETVWCAEYEDHLDPIIQREFGPVLNLRDLTTVDWAQLEPVDILTAGYPCQPFSHAGKRKGSDDVRHLWPYIAEAVRVLRPRRVVLENVAGHLSLGFGDVLRDLAEAGFDAEWCVLRASDVGAPHQRARLFIVAADAACGRGPASDSRGQRHGGGEDAGAVGRVDREDAGEARQRERARTVPGDRGGAAPADAEGKRRGRREEPRSDVECDGLQLALMGKGSGTRHPDPTWGQYEPAIRRWEHVLGRPAPHPTDPAGRLSPAFVEWMQGYPEGWTAELTRTQALKALGNAVVPQQGEAAIRLLESEHLAVAA